MRRPSLFACGGCCHVRVDGSEDDMPTQSSSGGWQCACMAFSGDGFEEDRPPVINNQPSPDRNGSDVYLILAPCSASSSRCLFSVLLDTIVVAVDGIHGVVGRCRYSGGVHLVRWNRHSNR
jgi:hypothetical protein